MHTADIKIAIALFCTYPRRQFAIVNARAELQACNIPG